MKGVQCNELFEGIDLKSTHFFYFPCLSPLKELSISITYLLQSLLEMLKLPSVCEELGFTLDCIFTMNAHVSNIALTCYFELRRLASIRRFLQVLQLPHLYLLLLCQELTTVTHCCLVLLMI